MNLANDQNLECRNFVDNAKKYNKEACSATEEDYEDKLTFKDIFQNFHCWPTSNYTEFSS